MDITDQLKRFMKPLTTRVQTMIVRGVIKLVNDKTKIQQIQASLLAGELKDGIEHYQEYGLSTNPPAGTEALVVFCGALATTASSLPPAIANSASKSCSPAKWRCTLTKATSSSSPATAKSRFPHCIWRSARPKVSVTTPKHSMSTPHKAQHSQRRRLMPLPISRPVARLMTKPAPCRPCATFITVIHTRATAAAQPARRRRQCNFIF